MPQAAVPQEATSLSEDEQRLGRQLAVASHPFGMVHRTAVMGDLATQALVTLGGGGLVIGVQAALAPGATLVQLPGLRLLARLGKRRMLVWAQLLSLLTSLPLLAYGGLQELGAWGLPLAMVSLGLTTVLMAGGSTAWWPILHGYVPSDRTGRFFAVLRSGWHLALVVFFLGTAWWLDAHPGAFGAVFGVAWGCGAVRCVLLLRFPERRDEAPPPPGPAARAMLAAGPLRRYLIGVSLDGIIFRSLPAFTILLLRREAGLSDAQTMTITVAAVVGGLVSLYPAGRLTDRLGASPVLLVSCVLRTALVLGIGLLAWLATATTLLWGCAALFLVYALLSQAFGLAEIKVLFRLVPAGAPSPYIVVSQVARSVVAAVAAVSIGGALELALQAGAAPRLTYLVLFGVLSALQLAAALPFWGLRASLARRDIDC